LNTTTRPLRTANSTSITLTHVLNAGSLPQKGIVYYGLAQNRQNPLAGTLNAAIFNTFRRTRGQILYWAVPMLIAYETMQWAIEK
jgi:ubiquinol-cytochrome c reductase subunit 8